MPILGNSSYYSDSERNRDSNTNKNSKIQLHCIAILIVEEIQLTNKTCIGVAMSNVNHGTLLDALNNISYSCSTS